MTEKTKRASSPCLTAPGSRTRPGPGPDLVWDQTGSLLEPVTAPPDCERDTKQSSEQAAGALKAGAAGGSGAFMAQVGLGKQKTI